MLSHASNRTGELNFESAIVAQLLVKDARELGLLALDPERVPRRVSNGGEIELRQHAMALAAVLELRRGQSLCDQRLRRPELIEHVEGGRMECRGARFLAEIGSRLNDRYRHTIAHQIGGGGKPDRPGTGDQNAVFARHNLCTCVIRSYRRVRLTVSAESLLC